MKIRVQLDDTALTVHTQHPPTTPPPRLATAIETAHHHPTTPASTRGVEVAVDTRPALDRPALDRAEPAPAETSTPSDTPAGTEAVLQTQALGLLDAGLSDTAVCTTLGISPGRLRRWDDDPRRDDRLERLTHHHAPDDTDTDDTGTTPATHGPARAGRRRAGWEAWW